MLLLIRALLDLRRLLPQDQWSRERFALWSVVNRVGVKIKVSSLPA